MYKPAQIALAVLSGRKTMINIERYELDLLGFKKLDNRTVLEAELKYAAELMLYHWIDDMYDEIDQLRAGK